MLIKWGFGGVGGVTRVLIEVSGEGGGGDSSVVL